MLRLNEPHARDHATVHLVDRQGVLRRLRVSIADALAVDDDRPDRESADELSPDTWTGLENLLAPSPKDVEAAHDRLTVEQVIDHDVIREQRHKRVQVTDVECVELALNDPFWRSHGAI